jgi:hypothetical protein
VKKFYTKSLLKNSHPMLKLKGMKKRILKDENQVCNNKFFSTLLSTVLEKKTNTSTYP